MGRGWPDRLLLENQGVPLQGELDEQDVGGAAVGIPLAVESGLPAKIAWLDPNTMLHSTGEPARELIEPHLPYRKPAAVGVQMEKLLTAPASTVYTTHDAEQNAFGGWAQLRRDRAPDSVIAGLEPRVPCGSYLPWVACVEQPGVEECGCSGR